MGLSLPIGAAIAHRRASAVHARSSGVARWHSRAMQATPDPWSPSNASDPVAEALHGVHMDGAFYCRSDFTAPWGLALPAIEDCLLFHVVIAGGCRLEIAGEAPRHLAAGDLALVPHGAGHVLNSEAGAAAAGLFTLPRESCNGRYEALRHGGGGAPTRLLCGALRFVQPLARQLVALLPPVIHVTDWPGHQRAWIAGTLRYIAAEASEPRAGGEAVLTRLADILVIEAIRAWIAAAPAAQAGWLGALRDRQLGRALAQLHRDPARDWSVASLAEAAHMSRSTFAARFTELVGMPAMQYLARWRMQQALARLRDSDMSIAELAGQLGYESEAAFSRAFKRLLGISPGAARRGAVASLTP